ncbi:MAG: hypothetical protein ACRDQ5_24875 [Sciscionella sp.]
MAIVYQHKDGEPYSADLLLNASVSLELPTGDSHAVLKFEDDTGSLHDGDGAG